MSEISFSQFKKSIVEGSMAPVYFIHGDENYFIDEIHHLIENNALPEQDRGFNQYVLFGKDTDLPSVISKAMNYPMMAEHQLVLVKDAQFLTNTAGKGKGAAEAEANALKVLENYLKNPVKTSYLIFSLNGNLARNTKIYKLFEKYAQIFQAVALNEGSVGDFIRTYLAASEIAISRENIDLIVSSVGTDLKRISFELEKIILNVAKGQEISSDKILSIIGFSREFNFLELQNAIIDGNVKMLQKILLYFSQQTKTFNVGQTVASLYGFYTKILKAYDPKVRSANDLAAILGAKPFYAQKLFQAKRSIPLVKLTLIIEKLQEADLRIKGIIPGKYSDKEIMEELAYHILA